MPQTIHFDPSGGAPVVQLRCGNAQPGSYDVSLIDGTTCTVLEHWSGDFRSPARDAHTIQYPVANLDGTSLRLTSEVALMSPFNSATVFLTVSQNGKKLGTAFDTETSTESSVEVDMTVALCAKSR